jgi:hypothetical protein
MIYYQTRSHIGPDGKLSIPVPEELANTEVRVTVEPSGNGAGAIRRAQRTMTLDKWRKFINETAGSVPDFPDVPR